MSTKYQIALKAEELLAAVTSGQSIDIIIRGVAPGEYTHELKYVEADGGFFIVDKSGTNPDEFVGHERVYRILTENALLTLTDPFYATDKAVFSAAQLSKLQQKLADDKA